jgi:hypothetical protein
MQPTWHVDFTTWQEGKSNRTTSRLKAKEANGSKKSRETYALSELQAAKDLLLNVSRLNPAELHVQEMKRHSTVARNRLRLPLEKRLQIGAYPVFFRSACVKK